MSHWTRHSKLVLEAVCLFREARGLATPINVVQVRHLTNYLMCNMGITIKKIDPDLDRNIRNICA